MNSSDAYGPEDYFLPNYFVSVGYVIYILDFSTTRHYNSKSHTGYPFSVMFSKTWNLLFYSLKHTTKPNIYIVFVNIQNYKGTAKSPWKMEFEICLFWCKIVKIHVRCFFSDFYFIYFKGRVINRRRKEKREERKREQDSERERERYLSFHDSLHMWLKWPEWGLAEARSSRCVQGLKNFGNLLLLSQVFSRELDQMWNS